MFHSTVASVLWEVREGGTSPVGEDGQAGAVQIWLSLPRKIRTFLRVDFIKHRDFAALAPDELMSRDAIDDKVFEGGVDVVRGDAVRRAGDSETPGENIWR